MFAHHLPIGHVIPGRLLGDAIVSLGFCDRDTVEDIVRGAGERTLAEIARVTA